MSHHSPPEISPETTAEHLHSLQVVADCIDAIASAGSREPELLDMMDRNVRHIAIMCNMDHIKNSGTDLKPFSDAAARGLAWLSN